MLSSLKALIKVSWITPGTGIANICGKDEKIANIHPDLLRDDDTGDFCNMEVVVTDVNGVFQKSYNLASMIKLDKKTKTGSTGLFGFTVNKEGDMLFTIATSFAVFVVSPEGQVSSFGGRGGSPGKFNIVSGIAADDKGNTYVTDRFKSVFMVFDRDFNFKGEFGYRGFNPDNLVVPDSLAVDGSGKVYVSQLRKRGVSVFVLNFDRA